MGDPDFLLRAASDDHVCGSPQREPHAVPQGHGSPQEIRGKPFNSLSCQTPRLFLRRSRRLREITSLISCAFVLGDTASALARYSKAAIGTHEDPPLCVVAKNPASDRRFIPLRTESRNSLQCQPGKQSAKSWRSINKKIAQCARTYLRAKISVSRHATR
jgi:hypothetical protein